MLTPRLQAQETYLVYSATWTPAQLSLPSEAIAKYSAFLEEKREREDACHRAPNPNQTEIKTNTAVKEHKR